MRVARKYSNQITTIRGVNFDSRKEARRYTELCLLVRAGHIKNVTCQPKVLLVGSFTFRGHKIRPITYTPDFEYDDVRTRLHVFEDVKGFKTDVYKLKKKLFLMHLKTFYGEDKVDFRET